MKSKKLLLTTCAVGLLLGSTLTFATSCSEVSREILDDMVNHGDYTKFSTNVTVNEMIQNALLSSTGQEAMRKLKAQEIIYNWYAKKAEKNETKKNRLDELKKEVDDDYDSNVQSYKDSHRNDWKYYFQNEVLNTAGGYEETYKQAKLYEKVAEEFTSEVFSEGNFNFGWKHGDPAHPIYSLSGVGYEDDAFNDPDNWDDFGFYSEVQKEYNPNNFDDEGNLKESTETIQEYTWIQNYIFERWFNETNPYLVSMSLWKFSDSIYGMDTIYDMPWVEPSEEEPEEPVENSKKITRDGEDDPDAPVDDGSGEDGGETGDETPTASIAFPYFQHSMSNDTETAQGMFWKFLNEICNENGTYKTSNTIIQPEWMSGIVDTSGTKIQDVGLVSIPLEYTEDSSTLMIVSSTTAFTELDAYFAAAAANGLLSAYGSTSTTSNMYERNAMAFKSTIAENDILDNFLLSTNELALAKAGGKAVTDLISVYAPKQANEHTPTIFNDNGEYAAEELSSGNYSNQGSINSFKLKNSPFTFILDTFGVHLIAIDGSDYISQGTTEAEKKQHQKEILLFRTAQSKIMGSASYGSIDLATQLSNYFSSNLENFILDMAKIEGSPFYSEEFANSEKEIELFQSLYYLNYKTTQQANIKSANESLLNLTQPQVTNFGVDFNKNGILAPLPYVFNSDNSTYAIVEETMNIPLKDDNGLINNSSITELQNNVREATIEFINAFGIIGNDDTSGSMRYSEQILVKQTKKNNVNENLSHEDQHAANEINAAIYSFATDGNNFGNSEKAHAFDAYLSEDNFYDMNTDEFEDPNLYNAMTTTYIPSQLISSSTPYSFYSYNLPQNGLGKDPINEYAANMNDFWKEKRENTSGIHYLDENISYYTFLSTIKYLTDNNYENLRTYLQQSITPSNPAVVAWVARDNTKLNTDFLSDTPAVVHGWQNNPNNVIGSSYQQGNGMKPTSYIDYDKYWQSATIVNESNSLKLMGFCGLQTKNNSSNMPSSVSDAVFTNLYNATTGSVGTGVLNAYGSKEQLITLIEGTQGVDQVNSIANTLVSLIPSLDVSYVLEKYDDDHNALSLEEKQNRLIDIINNELSDDKYYERINSYDGTNLSEIKNPANRSSNIIYDAKDSNIASRTLIIQINYLDVVDETSFANLINLLGDDVMMKIAIQFALDSAQQSLAIAQVIKTAYGDGHASIVYDKTMADQLGKVWIEDNK